MAYDSNEDTSGRNNDRDGVRVVFGWDACLELATGSVRAEVTAVGWDTEGTGREKTNLLRPQTGIGLRSRVAG